MHMTTAGALQQAFAALQAGDLATTLLAARQVLQAEPGNPDAWTLLGLALQAQQEYAEAVQAFETLTRISPLESSHWMNLGTALRQARELPRALHAYATAAARGAHGADFQFNVGLLHQERGDYDNALRLLAEAKEAAPRDAQIALQYAQCCYELLRIDDALQAIEGWEQFEMTTAEQLAQLALLLLNLGEQRKSETAVQRLLQAPAAMRPAAMLRLAQVMERSNRLDDAVAWLARLLANPDAAALGHELTLLEAQIAQRQKRHARGADLFASLAAQEEPHRQHIALFPLAKSQQAMNQHTLAWTTLVHAHAAQMLHLQRTHPEMAACSEPPLLIAQRGCVAADVARWQHRGAPPLHESPVFIVAFPRSGTTLLEQALDAHPLLVSMDEQPFLQQIIDRMEDLGCDYPFDLGKLEEHQLQELRNEYLALVRGKVELAAGQRLVDKNPLNLLRLPAIQRLFPRSRIIVAIRHPLDVVLSCYTQHFRAPEFALLCRNPATLARGFRRCFDFWYTQAEGLQPAILESRYEDLVSDFDMQMRRIAAFLQLPWDDAMLKPGDRARAKGYISTPSYSQVIEPVNTRAIGKWQPYRVELEAARAELQPYISRWGYDR